MSFDRSSRAVTTRIGWVLRACFVVPASQLHVLDLPYQFYLFEVFHQSRVNRLAHAIGIPISLMAMYVLLSPIPGGPQIALACVAGIHLAIALRFRLGALIPAMLAVHAALWLLAMHGHVGVMTFDGPFWRHPAFFMLAGATVQWGTHGLETYVPPPLSGTSGWRPMRDLFTPSSIGHGVFGLMLAPVHILVELISSWRNLFLLLVLAAWEVGYRPASMTRLRTWTEHQRRRAQPVIEIDAFRAAWDAEGALDRMGTL